MSNNNQDNIRKFTKEHNFGFGTVLFLGIFIYVVIVLFIYFSSDPIVRYDVVEGSLSSQNIYRAMAIRDEHVIESPYSGYVNFLAREGQKVAVGDIVYTVDETGRLTLSELYRRVSVEAKKGNADIVIVDYLQLLRTTGNLTRYEQVTEISFQLKAMAKEFNITLIALSQLNRASCKRCSVIGQTR